MLALRLFAKLTAYYAGGDRHRPAGAVPVPVPARVHAVRRRRDLDEESAHRPGVGIRADGGRKSASLHETVYWLAITILGALLTALPSSWVYISVRNSKDYDQSLVDTIVVLPIVVTSIIIIVQNSLALAFSIAGIAAAVRFRNSLKSSGDALFILLAVGIGLSAGIGALELAIVMSVAFNYVFLILWVTDYGDRHDIKKHYMTDCDPHEARRSRLRPRPRPRWGPTPS